MISNENVNIDNIGVYQNFISRYMIHTYIYKSILIVYSRQPFAK